MPVSLKKLLKLLRDTQTIEELESVPGITISLHSCVTTNKVNYVPKDFKYN